MHSLKLKGNQINWIDDEIRKMKSVIYNAFLIKNLLILEFFIFWLTGRKSIFTANFVISDFTFLASFILSHLAGLSFCFNTSFLTHISRSILFEATAAATFAHAQSDAKQKKEGNDTA